MKHIFWLIMLALIATSGQAQQLTIQYSDDREDRTVPITMFDDAPYLPVSTVSEIFGATTYWRSETRQMAVHIDDNQFVLIADSPFIKVGDSVWNLGLAIQYKAGRMWAPARFVDTVIDSFVAEDIVWNSDLSLLSVTLAKDQINILDMKFSADYQETKVTVFTSEALAYRTEKSTPGHLVVVFDEGNANDKIFSDPYSHGFVTSVDATNYENNLKLDFHYNSGAKSYKIESYNDDSPRIELSFLGYDVNQKPEPPKLRDKRSNQDLPDFVSDLDLIVIDPGHGGKDAGAVGPEGTKEKDIALNIATRVAELIESQLGIRTFLTRDDDTFIPLGKRTEMANNLSADLFISIHCNASPSRAANGAETYFLSLAKTNEARAVAGRENASLKYEMPEDAIQTMGDLDFILWDLAQYEYLEESSVLAENIQEQLGAKLSIVSRRVNQAPFYVLNGAYMPAVLVETAFISNKREERMLNTPAFRQTVAEAIVAAVERYKRHYDKKMAHND